MTFAPTSAPPPQPARLGRLERVDLREVWKGEALDFTPWLAHVDNIALLGESIGLELEVESTESGVGPYRADILCKDTASSQWVLIENQLERTNHIHLGQLLTYAAGLDAATVVWVARQFTDEHRAALDWLNEITDSRLNFFGLEVELWRIGSSDVAPKFNVVSQPNDWRATVKKTVGDDESVLSGGRQLHLEFWTQFRQFMEERNSPVRVGKPSADPWKSFSLGRTRFALIAVNRIIRGNSAVYLQIQAPNAKPHFHLIKQKYDHEVLTALGPNVEWRELPERAESQIVARRDSTMSDRSTWPELNAWFAGTLESMNTLFRPIVATLDASEFEQPLNSDQVAAMMEEDADEPLGGDP